MGRGKTKTEPYVKVVCDDIVGRDARGNLIHAFAVMEGEHRLPDAPSEPFSSQAGGQSYQGPEPTGRSRLLHHHEGNDAAAHLTFQHTLIRVMEGVCCPSAIATIADLGSDQRVNMKSPGRKYLRREAGDFFCVFGESWTDCNLRILRETAKPGQNGAKVQLDESETLLFQETRIRPTDPEATGS